MSYFIELCNNKVKILDATKKGKVVRINETKSIFSAFNSNAIDTTANEINELGGETRHTHVILNTTAVTYREVKTPVLNAKNTRQIIENEVIAAQPNAQEIITAFVPLKNVSEDPAEVDLKRFYTASIDKSSYDDTLQLLDEIDCKKPKGIGDSLTSLFNYISHTELANNPAPYLLIDLAPGIIKTFLFDQTTFIMSRSARVASREFEDIVTAIREQVSLMQQFQSTRRNDSKITSVFFFGDFHGVEVLAKACGEDSELTYEALPPVELSNEPEEFEYLSYVYLLGSVLGGKYTTNFIAREKQMKRDANSLSIATKILLGIVAAVLAILAAISIYLLLVNSSLQRQINKETDYITSSNAAERVTKIADQESQIATYQGIYDELSRASNLIQVYLPNVDSSLVKYIYGYADVNVINFTFNTTSIMVDCETHNVDNPYYYVNYLQNSNMYSKVEYNGFQYDETNEVYKFSVTATLWEGGN